MFFSERSQPFSTSALPLPHFSVSIDILCRRQFHPHWDLIMVRQHRIMRELLTETLKFQPSLARLLTLSSEHVPQLCHALIALDLNLIITPHRELLKGLSANVVTSRGLSSNGYKHAHTCMYVHLEHVSKWPAGLSKVTKVTTGIHRKLKMLHHSSDFGIE